MLFQLTIIGSGSASPTKGRFPTSQLLQVQNKGYLFDCGEGAQMRMIDFGISHSKIDVIFITHLHGDHFFGLFGLLTSMSLNQREKPLTIVAHPDLEPIVKTVIRTDKYELTFSIDFITTSNDGFYKVFEDQHVEVSTFPLVHRIETTGFVLKEKERPYRIRKEALAEYSIPVQAIKSITQGGDFKTPEGEIIANDLITTGRPKSRSFAFCTDTLYHPEIVPYIKGVNICYHEATFLDAEKERANNTNHTCASEAAMIAKLAEVDKLLIGHFSARYLHLEKHLSEAQAVFPNTELAIEGKTFDVPFL